MWAHCLQNVTVCLAWITYTPYCDNQLSTVPASQLLFLHAYSVHASIYIIQISASDPSNAVFRHINITKLYYYLKDYNNYIVIWIWIIPVFERACSRAIHIFIRTAFEVPTVKTHCFLWSNWNWNSDRYAELQLKPSSNWVQNSSPAWPTQNADITDTWQYTQLRLIIWTRIDVSNTIFISNV